MHVLRHVVRVQDVVAVAAALLFAVHPVHTEAVWFPLGRISLLFCRSPLRRFKGTNPLEMYRVQQLAENIKMRTQCKLF